MRRMRRAKIIATLGPASISTDMIQKLFLAGADVFRINMSHASHDSMRQQVSMIREVESKVGRPIGIMVDLQGPKLRLDVFADSAVMLEKGQKFILDAVKQPGNTEIGRAHV